MLYTEIYGSQFMALNLALLSVILFGHLGSLRHPQGLCHPLSARAEALAPLGPPLALCMTSPSCKQREGCKPDKGAQCGPKILGGVLPTWLGSPRCTPSSDPLLSQQPSEDLVPYDTDLYQRQTHEYYPYLSSDGESHSGE